MSGAGRGIVRGVRQLIVFGCALALVACTAEASVPEDSSATTATTTTTTIVPDLARLIEATLDVESDGATEPFEFDIPAGTRSVGITAVGGSNDVIAVTQLTLGDGIDRVGVGRIPPVLLENVASQHLRMVPGDVFQEAGTGVQTLTFPNSPGTGDVPPGQGSVRVSSTGRSLDLTIVLAPDADNLTLPLDVFVSDPDLALGPDSSALTRAADLLGQAGIIVEFRTIASVDTPDGFRAEAGLRVDGPVASLVELAATVGTDALDVFVVPQLDVSGFSPRIPGPLVPSPLRAVVVKSTSRPSDLGRVIAHEVGHYLGLHHLELYTDDHRPVPDPIPDTEPGSNNLMDAGTILTEGQIEVIRRSPLLEPTG